MAVDPKVSRAIMKVEVEAAQELASTFGWILCPDYEALTLRVGMRAHNGDVYVVDVTLENYRELPAAYDFVDLKTGAVGASSAYPKGPDSFFNTAGPCICTPFNLKAYKRPEQRTGLHNDWPIGDWANSTAQGFPWSNHATIAGALMLIQTRLDRPTQYMGHMSA
jgi:hypothetical protein